MAQKKTLKAERLGTCSYKLHGSALAGNPCRKKRGFIVERDSETLVIPFKERQGEKRCSHKVRETENGCLKLSPARQKITLTITFDRTKDSQEMFLEQFNQLTDNYLIDVLKYEVSQCLE